MKWLFAFLLCGLLAPSFAFAVSDPGGTGGVGTSEYSGVYGTGFQTGATAAYPAGTPNASITWVIGTIISGLLSILGIIFLILVIYGGVLWMTAAGNPDQVKKAQTLLRDGVIGLIIILSSYAISYSVLTYLGSNVY